MENFTVLLGWC